MKHFKHREYAHSDTARAKGMLNLPTEYQYYKFEKLVELIIDPLRIHIKTPITITSGFRSEKLNKYIGGAATSQHLAADDSVAIDFVCKNMRKTFEYIVDTFEFDQCILEKDKSNKIWVHLSLRTDSTNRGEALMYNKGKYTKYEPTNSK